MRPFSKPIFDEAARVMSQWLPRNARLLDAGCGPGRELKQMARLVPDGEVVGIDLAAGMVVSAHRAARAAGLDHCALYQSDVGELPKISADNSIWCIAASRITTIRSRRPLLKGSSGVCVPAACIASLIRDPPGTTR